MNSILLDFYSAWQTFDAELIINHLDNNFVYDSQWVFESLNRNEYADYIRGIFQTLRSKNAYIDVSIVDDPYNPGDCMLKFIQGGNICYYRVKIHENKVIKGDLCMF